MPPMGKLTIAVDCELCGFSNGTPAENNSTRCLSCGRFVSIDSNACCVRHEMTRDPTVEPY